MDHVLDKKTTHVDVFCALGAGCLSVLLQDDTALAVLKNDVFVDRIANCF